MVLISKFAVFFLFFYLGVFYGAAFGLRAADIFENFSVGDDADGELELQQDLPVLPLRSQDSATSV